MNVYDDPLYRESIPQRCSPPDGPLDGPTAAWMRAHPENVTPLHPQTCTRCAHSEPQVSVDPDLPAQQLSYVCVSVIA